MSKSVLSTKKLAVNQRELLLNSGIGFAEKEFIAIESIPFEVDDVPENLIFTSKNALRAILEHERLEEFRQKDIFCVGAKTADLLKENGFKDPVTADSGAELGAKIVKHHNEEQFLFFCGRKRNPDLPKMLIQKNIPLREVEVYDTQLTPKKVDRVFDGVLFFSPSAVESFCSENDLSESLAFCIGKTTASEAKKHTVKIIVATKPTIENVIVQVVKKFRS